MSVEKLYQNRGVILGLTQGDAATYASEASEEDVTFVASAGSKSLILGSVGGMHVRTVYVTPHAASGLNYDVALEALQCCLARTGGQVVHLGSRG